MFEKEEVNGDKLTDESEAVESPSPDCELKSGQSLSVPSIISAKFLATAYRESDDD